MADFIRARSPEQKELRMSEIKTAADSLFLEKPYHEITLSTIAERLSWTRANLYRYVSTKEEIFLELTEDRMAAYYDALMAAVPEGCGYSPETLSEVWASIVNAHTDYFKYGSILSSIIETNVSVERLASFKSTFYEMADSYSERLATAVGIPLDAAYLIQLAVYYHAVGLTGVCHSGPLIHQALELAGIERPNVELKDAMRDFILMNVRYRLG
ncbi:MAG: TetR family transcriptional regulator [Thermoplasmata archaeon]|nr:TetR family transcriptional regulator [Thermoplasmata archaeon]